MSTLMKQTNGILYEEIKEVKASLATEVTRLRAENRDLRVDVQDALKEIRIDNRELTAVLRQHIASLSANSEAISGMREEFQGFKKGLAEVKKSLSLWDAFRLVFPGMFANKKIMTLMILVAIIFLGFTADGIVDAVNQVNARLGRLK